MRRSTAIRASGYRTLPGPRTHFHEQVWQHEMVADANGRVPVAIVNERFDGGRGLGFLVESAKAEFPAQFEWQNLQEGQYAVGNRAVDESRAWASRSPKSAAS